MGDETPTAILTKGQRKYFRDEKEPVQERTTRTRVRRRVQAAVTEDIPLLESAAEPDDLLKGADLREFREGLESTARLVYQLAHAAGYDPDELIDEAISGLRHDRADEIWDALERGEIRADFEELEVLRNGGRIPEQVYTEAFKKRLGETDGLTLDQIIEAWEESRK